MRPFLTSKELLRLLLSLGLLSFSLAVFAGSGPTTLPNPQPSAISYNYGTSVALTPDGGIAVVGANAGGYGFDTPPAVYVFQYANGAWGTTPIATVCDPAAGASCSSEATPTDAFGSTVAVSGVNSNSSFILVVGSPGGGVVSGGTVSYGLVYVYQCTLGSTPGCTQLTTIADPAVTSTDQFGSAVAVSQDGTTLLVGAWGANEYGGNGTDENNEGAVYVYTSSGGTWNTSPRATLLDPAPTCTAFGSPPYQQMACDKFGYAVALSGTGNNVTALIGAPGAVISKLGSLEPGEGAAFFFGSDSSGALQPLTQVIDPNTGVCTDPSSLVCDEFGRAVALSANGNEAAIAGPNTIAAVYGEAGAVTILGQTSAGSWSGGAQQGCTYTNPNPNMNNAYIGLGGFGWSVALSADGSALSVGMPEGAEGANNGGYGGTGEVDIFDGLPQTQCSNTPTTVLVDPAVTQNSGSPSPADFFGAAVAISGDASVTLAGAPDTTGPAPGKSTDNGLAYVYGAPAGQVQVPLSLSITGPNNVNVNPGEDLTYTLTITNTSTMGSALNVTLSGTLAAGVTLVSDSAAGAACNLVTDTNGNTIGYTCTLASLGPGASWKPSVTMQIDSSDAGQAVVAASANVKASNSSNNPSVAVSVSVAQPAPQAGLAVAYEPFVGCANDPGSVCEMTAGVTNNGSLPANNVGLTITIPYGTTVSNVQVSGPASSNCFVILIPSYEISCGAGSLPSQWGLSVVFSLNFSSTDQNGQSGNSVATASASNTGNFSASYSFTIGSASSACALCTAPYDPSGGFFGGAGLGWLELGVLSGSLWFGRRRRRTDPRDKPGKYLRSHGYTVLVIMVSVAVLMLTGCAVTLKPSPSNGSGGLASPVMVNVTSNTEIVNAAGSGPAASVSATISGNPYTLNCNPQASTCSLSQAFATGAYTLNVTAPVAVPAFYSTGGNPTVSCNLTMGFSGQVNTCVTLTATANFSVGCSKGPLAIVTNTTLIPAPAGKPMTPVQLQAKGGCPSYTWSVSNPSGLPPGISLSSTGLISGTETAACTEWTFDTSIQVSDSLGDTGGAVMTFNNCAQ